jgi:DMSO/TMAO reductase YedYZ molybdopterin-dependent catalytic subunit
MVPAQQWEGVAVAAILARAGVEPAARFLKVHAGNFTVLLPLEEALRGTLGALSEREAADTGARGATAVGSARSRMFL